MIPTREPYVDRQAVEAAVAANEMPDKPYAVDTLQATPDGITESTFHFASPYDVWAFYEEHKP